MSKQAIFDKKNVLVAGGAGFIGSHLADELIKTSKVICVDNYVSGEEKNIDHLLSSEDFEFIRHDLKEPLDLEALPELEKFRIRHQGVQEIYNLACPMSPRRFPELKEEVLYANAYATKNALELAARYNAKFLHFSSSVVYGPRREGNPKIAEDDIGKVDMLSERSAYDEGKRFAETLVSNFREKFGFDAKIARIFRVYGPRMKLGEGHMIPDFIESSLDGMPLEVHGDESFSSSFCYVGDIIDAALKFMESPHKGPINIGSDIAFKIGDIAKRIIALTDSKSEIKYGDPMLFMTPLCLPDISKARTELGWIPIMTLESGLKKTIEDLRAMKNLRSFKEAA
jgi:UDP-glucuronate decarboxylase